MKWITDTEIEAIKQRIMNQSFPESPAQIYQWYTRFFSLGLAILTAIPFAVDKTPKWGFMTALWLIVAYFQNEGWMRYKEQFVLKRMLNQE